MDALPAVLALDRRTIRERFEHRFSARVMAASYVDVYQQLLQQDEALQRLIA
ncbi:MAG TPA: hypothetical protein VIT66_10980 [Lysobacter sp.]